MTSPSYFIVLWSDAFSHIGKATSWIPASKPLPTNLSWDSGDLTSWLSLETLKSRGGYCRFFPGRACHLVDIDGNHTEAGLKTPLRMKGLCSLSKNQKYLKCCLLRHAVSKGIDPASAVPRVCSILILMKACGYQSHNIFCKPLYPAELLAPCFFTST